MKNHNDQLEKLRLTIILMSIVGLLSFSSMTITIFAYGGGNKTLFYMLLYPLFFVSTTLIIVKVRSGFLLTLLIAITYSVLLTSEVGKYLIFNFQNNVLIWVLLLPYLIFLLLIPLTIIHLTKFNKYAKLFEFISIFTAVSFFVFSILDRFNKDYFDHIFIDAEINKQGQVTLRGC